jgi:hypothetical protein
MDWTGVVFQVRWLDQLEKCWRAGSLAINQVKRATPINPGELQGGPCPAVWWLGLAHCWTRQLSRTIDRAKRAEGAVRPKILTSIVPLVNVANVSIARALWQLKTSLKSIALTARRIGLANSPWNAAKLPQKAGKQSCRSHLMRRSGASLKFGNTSKEIFWIGA